MQLEIRTRECLYILAIGIFFSLALCLLCYILLEENLLHGLAFGLILGLCLSLCAILYTFILNRYFLPRVRLNHWSDN